MEIYTESENLKLLEAQEYENYLLERKFVRTPLIMALISLLCSVVIGAGVFLSVPAFIISAKRCAVKKSKSLKWAMVISAITTVICIIFIACFAYALSVGIFEYLNPTV